MLEGRWYVVEYMAHLPNFLILSCFFHANRIPLRLKTLLLCAAVDGVPPPVGCRRHLELVVADRVRDGVDDGSGSADCTGLAATLDAERIAGAKRRGVIQFERRQIVRARHGVVHERRGHELTRAVINCALEKVLADSLGKTAMDLAFDDHRIEQGAKIRRRDQTNR